MFILNIKKNIICFVFILVPVDERCFPSLPEMYKYIHKLDG